MDSLCRAEPEPSVGADLTFALRLGMVHTRGGRGGEVHLLVWSASMPGRDTGLAGAHLTCLSPSAPLWLLASFRSFCAYLFLVFTFAV